MNPKMMSLKRELEKRTPHNIGIQIRKQIDARCSELYHVYFVFSGMVVQCFEVWSPHSGGFYWDEVRG